MAVRDGLPEVRWPKRRRVERLLAAAWLAVVVLVSLLAQGRSGWVDALAASPERAREGKLWLLFSSALLVDHPLVLSLVCFVALGALARVYCRPRLFWSSAFLGQVAATLAVYVFAIGLARTLVAGAFDASMGAPDYGVSTISAAWLGSIACVAWRRRGRSRAGKLSIALACVAVSLFAYSVRPDLTVLSGEHVVAFALGIAAADRRRLLGAVARFLAGARRLTLVFRTCRLDPVASTAILAAVVALAVGEAPTGLAALRARIAAHLHPTLSRCALGWNRQGNAPRLLIGRVEVRAVRVVTTGLLVRRDAAARAGRPKRVDYCRYTFTAPGRAITIDGLWQRGRITNWSTPLETRPHTAPHANATLRPDGRLGLRRHAPKSELPSS